jgi:hypothetical protein
MATFKHEREECRCLDKETNIRIFWLDIENPGRAYAYLSPEYVTSAANQFHRYGILEEMELPSPIQTPRLGLNVRHLWALFWSRIAGCLYERMLRSGEIESSSAFAVSGKHIATVMATAADASISQETPLQ